MYKVTGLVPHMPGTLDDCLIERGFTGFTFEGGQHDGMATIENQEAIILLTLIHCGCLEIEGLPHSLSYHQVLAKTVLEGKRTFKVIDRYEIKEGEECRMKQGYLNFHHLKKGEILARNNEGFIKAGKNARILMPLYQDQGNDGFFIMEQIENKKVRLNLD